MYKSDTISELAKALSSAQTGFDAIKRDRTVRVQTKAGGSYEFSYAPLDTILAAIRPALASNGLALVQSVEVDQSGHEALRTTLMHSSGEWIATDTAVLLAKGESSPQAYGSALTYAARYGVTRLLCLASEDDDDGNLASGNHSERVQRGSKPAKEAPYYVTGDELAALRARVKDTDTNETDFCRFLAVKSLDELPVSKMAAASAALDAKAKKIAREKAAAAADEAAVEHAAEQS